MSALSVLYLVLPLVLVFCIHELEVIATNGRRIRKHGEQNSISTKSLSVAACEELLVLLAATCYVLTQGKYATEVWSAVFMAFSVRLVLHIIRAVALRKYIPGLVSAILAIPYAVYGIHSISLVMSFWTMMLYGFIGIVLGYANLCLAHRLGGLFK